VGGWVGRGGGHQDLRDGANIVCQTGPFAKGGAIMVLAVAGTRLGAQELDHLAHRHTRREAVGVHDEVGADPPLAEGQVCLGHYVANHPFLPVPAAEFVAQLRPPRVPDQHLRVEGVEVRGGGCMMYNLVNVVLSTT
jgi:hypothetical protein